MTLEPRAWLPEAALTAPRVEGALIDSVREWALRWLGDHECTLVLVADNIRTLSDYEEQVKVEGATVTATLSGRGKRLLLEAALDTRLPNDMNADDHALLEVFVRQIVEDLTSNCDRELGGMPHTSGQSITVALMLTGAEVGKLVCERQVIAARIRKQLGVSATRLTPLTDWRTALGPMPIALEGILGAVDLALEDLRNLETGDVLILDRDLDSPVSVRIHATKTDVGRGVLGHHEGRPTIAF